MAAQKIRILHPGQRAGLTSVKQAKWYVRRGRAEWIESGVSIRFRVEHHQNTAAESSIRATERVRQCGYDTNVRRDECTRNELKHLPFVGDIDRLMGADGSRRTSAPAGRCGPVNHIVCNGQPV